MSLVCVLGASGDIGSEVINQLLRNNYEVIAITRDRSNISKEHKNLSVCEGNVLDKDSIKDAVRSSNVIISALGTPVYRSPVCSAGISNIIELMTNYQKLIAVSAYGANDSASGIYSRFIRLVIPGHMGDKDRMEQIIIDSSTNYTIIRPTRLKRSGYTGEYQTNNLSPGLFSRVPIGDVGDLILHSIENNDCEIIPITS